MLIKEYRIVLPISVEEYQVGQLYAVAEASKNETSGKEGVEVLKNEPYEKDGKKGQYTHKIYHLGSRVPGWLLPLIPKGCLKLYEEAWNEYPYCKTVLTNEMIKSLMIKIETWHKDDMGEELNVHQQDEDKLKQTEVVYIDIGAEDKPSKGANANDVTPSTFKSVKTGRGPLGPNWKSELHTNPACPHMCAYKLVTVECKTIAQGKVESFIHKFEKDLFTKFHKQLFCWIDDWVELSLEDIRRLEDDTKKELDQKLELETTGKH